MRTVTYRLGDLQSAVVRIGFVGENEHTRVIFDCKKVFDEYPSALAALTVQPPEGAAYPAVVIRDGDLVYWDVYDSDLVYDGRGEGQLAFSENGKAVRSFVFRTAIDRSIVPTGEVPEPLDDFLTRAGEALTAIPQTIQDTFGEISAEAETLPAGSSATAEFDSETMKVSFGIPAGADGAPGQDGAPGADGFSPRATVSKSGNVTTLTVTDAAGTTSAQILEGEGTDIIDDEAGEGDTDKVWSADKTAKEVSTLNGAINATQDDVDTIDKILVVSAGKDLLTGATFHNKYKLDGNGAIAAANSHDVYEIAYDGTFSTFSAKVHSNSTYDQKAIAFYNSNNTVISTLSFISTSSPSVFTDVTVPSGTAKIYLCTRNGSNYEAPTASSPTYSKTINDINAEILGIQQTYGQYLTPQMFNAKGDGTTDDTTAMQNAIDAAISTHKVLLLPIGSYKVTEPISVSGSFSMSGTNSFKMFGNANEYSTIKCTGTSLFTKESGDVNVNINGVVFMGNNSNILFDVGLENSVIENCTARDFGTIFKKKLALCHIHDNSFLSIYGYFSYGQVYDSFFTNNYINGANSANAICFRTYNFTSSRITENYIDYFKYGFYGDDTNYFKQSVISGNTFDIIWRVFNTRMQQISICNNLFTNISPTWFVNDQSETSKMNNADAEMLAYRPCAIYCCTSAGLTGSTAELYVEDIGTNGSVPLIVETTITGNCFDVRIPLYIIAPVEGMNISGNSYKKSKLLAFVDNGGDAEHLINGFEDDQGVILWITMATTNMYTNRGSFVDALHHINVDNIPRMLRSSNTKIYNGLYQYRNITKGLEVIHNNKLYHAVYDWATTDSENDKNKVKWFDCMGNQET